MRRRYRVKITTPGYVVIGLTLAVALAAINTGNNLLYLATSALLALMSVSGVLSVANLGFIEVDIESPEMVFARSPAPFRFRVRGPVWPCFFIRIETPYGSARVMHVRREQVITGWLTFQRRGKVHMQEVWLSSGFPLGLFRRKRRIEVETEVLVLPHPTPGRVNRLVEDKDGGYSRAGREGEEELKGVREYREGDKKSRIAWMAFARRGFPMVKEFEGTGGSRVFVRVGEISEDAVERAAWNILRLSEEGYEVGLILPEKRIPAGRGTEHIKRMLEELALA